MANQTHIPDAPNSILYRALRSAKADEMLSYNAIDEVRDMAGDNIRAEIATMRAEVNGKFAALEAQISGLRWTIGFAISFAALFLGALTLASRG